jgi:hypothetical protein
VPRACRIAATVAHHLEDHCGVNLFFNSPLESLCKQCHDKIWSDSEALGYQRGCDINGKPYKTKPIYIDKNKGRLSKSGGERKKKQQQ